MRRFTLHDGGSIAGLTIGAVVLAAGVAKAEEGRGAQPERRGNWQVSFEDTFEGDQLDRDAWGIGYG